MNRADEIIRVARDALIVMCGVFLVVMVGTGQVPAEYVPGLVPLILGLFAAPRWIRQDERRKRDDPGQDDG